MRILKHLLFAIGVHLTLWTVADAASPFTLKRNDATPLRTTSLTNARTRLLNQGGSARLEFQLPAEGEATVVLTDRTGRVLLREHLSARGPQVRTLGTALPANGPYTMRIEQEGITLLRKLVIEQA